MHSFSIKWKLVVYDIISYVIVSFFISMVSHTFFSIPASDLVAHLTIVLECVLIIRFLGSIYRQIWRYGGIQCYIRLVLTDACAYLIIAGITIFLPDPRLSLTNVLLVVSLNLLASLVMRMSYRYAYKNSIVSGFSGSFSKLLLHFFAGQDIESTGDDIQKIKVAIIGAGRVGVTLSEEMTANASNPYVPRCFIDIQDEKVGRSIHGIPVYKESEATLKLLREHEVQEIVVAIPNMTEMEKRSLYTRYANAGFHVKVYDYPLMETAGGKRQLRSFDIEELLFRKPVIFADTQTHAYYHDKVILITGGGGSIGSELCRQLAKMSPKNIIILDIYENGAYDVQQELKIAYGDKLDVQIEIVSVTNRPGLIRIFEAYHPEIVIHAAAHKHVPLMEHNCIEAVENNIFGTKNLIELCEAYNVRRFMMVSTDKAVNPTNVMGATKRMCEMMILSASKYGKVCYSATRFGNVLGSAGSVIPLFKKQISNGGPLTITDKRIIRYFMTISEASQLVLQSGALAHNGELFVLDMGQPVKILDLARNMIHLSGAHNIEIIETGLRPGEKLYEEILVKSEHLEKTSNSMIFVEKDAPHTKEEIGLSLEALKAACASGIESQAMSALKSAVITYKSPEEVNRQAADSAEIKLSESTVS